MMIPNDERLLNAQQASRLLGLRPATVRKLAWQGQIASVKVRRAVRFRRSDLLSLITERPRKVVL